MTTEPRRFDNAKAAVAAITQLYESSTTRLREAFDAFTKGKDFQHRVRAYYPFLSVGTDTLPELDARTPFGFVADTGTYMTTLTRPDIFSRYLEEQIALLIKNTGAEVEVGESATPIPIHFALGEDYHAEGGLDYGRLAVMPQIFDVPDLTILDDRIANGSDVRSADGARPLALFTAPRIDLSLMRLKHYTGTSARHFQNFVIFTNYQFYIDEFVRLAQTILAKGDGGSLGSGYTAFVEPGNVVTEVEGQTSQTEPPGRHPPRLPQMPAYHLKRADDSGITMINIGVGPSNAKNISDHVAVLRPHAWLMLGHCAGLRNSQMLGDYVLAHAYLRQDQVLDADLPREVPVPALAEIQIAIERAVGRVTGLTGYDLKRVMRTGTVATVDDRNWELRPSTVQNLPFIQSRAIALDMESSTIAANGFRFRVPYGTLLCVSDKPLHGQLKLPGMADSFYRERVFQHLAIGLETMALLRDTDKRQLHSRKLRSFNEVAFQ
ncbi:AMP nucleosidase [Labrys miyagiensis]|uniref:AMP nucleosidase n=1 Tax=Labrys miyagiensis TaxID=346912 RepID=A0ABQ6CJC8_9HYPH|nr:AMP nucleosidase [Labrys miyagiensis]GLS20383.1 AMP nucleosidase [Labrys miyagiensis]